MLYHHCTLQMRQGSARQVASLIQQKQGEDVSYRTKVVGGVVHKIPMVSVTTLPSSQPFYRCRCCMLHCTLMLCTNVMCRVRLGRRTVLPPVVS